MNFILKNKDRNHTNNTVHTRNNLEFEDFNFNLKYTDNYYNVQKLFSFQLNININNNLIENYDDKFLEDVSFFLADELQLCTLTKVNKIKKYFDNNNLKKEYIQWINQIKNQLIPVPMGIKEESIEYNYMGLYNLLQYLPENKSVLIIKPIFVKNIKNNTLYLYQNIEPHLILNNKCQTTSVFNCIKVNDNDQFNYNNVYDDGLKTYKIFNNDDFINKNKNKNEQYDFIYIKYIYIEKTKNKTKNELYSLNIFIHQLFYSLQFLNKNGDLVIDISFLSYLLPNIQIIYFLKNIFEEMRFVKSDLYINDIDSGFFIFSHLKNKLNFNKKVFNNINKNINKKYISSIFDNKLSNNFKNFLNKLYMTIFYKYEKYEQKKNFIKNELTIKPFSFQKYLDFMIEKSIKWSVSNKVPLNNIYLKFYDKKIPDNLKFKYFPAERGVDLKNIKMTNESIYSVTFPKEANKISALIKKYFSKCKTVIDTSANVGGNTLSFSKYFKNVVSIEIDLETKNALENNVHLYKRNNVDIILGDYTKLKDEFNTKYNEDETVYFFDPPWGGIYYKLEQVIDLYLSNINIIDLLPKNFVLKAPLNYNIQSVVQKYKNIQIYFLTNFIVLLPNYNISELEKIDQGYYY